MYSLPPLSGAHRSDQMPSRITLPEATRVQRLEPVTGRVRVVVDTDAANEIDDQFALAYAILSPERLAVEAVYAAPFQRPAPGGLDIDSPEFFVSPAEGMAQSHAEIMRVLEALDAQDLAGRVRLGSEEWLPDAETPVPNPAADDLIARARQGRPNADPIYVLALGAPTNVASALLAAPDIAARVVVVWLGGNGTWWSPGAEYNAAQDLHASRVLLGSGVPLVHVPCYQVTEKLMTTQHEIEQRVAGRGAIGAYLARIFRDFDHAGARMKPLWDVGAIAWLVQPAWCPSILTTSPVLHNDLSWGNQPSRHLIREVRDVNADAILNDFFAKLPT
jgi:purine nucleosidase